jgi:cellulose synthase/poly-beta-1,6-N-acetylglucosamine synthase-like glycosyltransferase
MMISLWITVTIIHLLMVVVLALQFARFRSGTNENRPTLSIIIAAHNELENLKKLIPQLVTLNYSSFEIIVALDRCTDKSSDFLLSTNDPRLKFIEIENTEAGWNEKKFALNSAIHKAEGEWLVFTDADCIPISPDWLTQYAKQIDHKTDILIGYSPYQAKGSFLSSYIQFEAFMTAFQYLGAALMKIPYMSVGRNMAIRKSFFEKVNGYENIKSIKGGDDDLFIQKNANKHNTKVILGKESIVETYPKKTWSAYFHQKVRHLSVGSRYKPKHRIFLSLYHFSHLLFWILLLFQNNFQLIVSVILFYLFIKLGSYRFAASKMVAGFNYILLPLVDILYAIFTTIIACWSKLEKDIRWKN